MNIASCQISTWESRATLCRTLAVVIVAVPVVWIAVTAIAAWLYPPVSFLRPEESFTLWAWNPLRIAVKIILHPIFALVAYPALWAAHHLWRNSNSWFALLWAILFGSLCALAASFCIWLALDRTYFFLS